METQQLFSRKISPDSINLLTKTTEKKKAPRTEQLRVASVSFFHSLLSHGSWIHQSCFPCGLLYAFRASGDKQMLIHAPAPHNTSPAYGCCCCCCYCNRLQTHLHCSAQLRSWNYFFFFVFLWQQQELKTSLVFSGINIVCGRKQKATGLWETHFAHRHSS